MNLRPKQTMAFHSHVGLLAFPFGTHAAPLLALVKQLAGAAPATCFSFFSSPDSNRTILAKHVASTCDNVRVYDVWDGTPQGFAGSHSEAVGLFLKASPENFEKEIESAEKEAGLDVCCLISDAFLWFVCDLVEKRKVPWVAFWTAASCSLSAHVYTDEIVRAVGSIPETEKPDQVSPFIPPGLPPTLNMSDLPPELFLDKNPSPLAITINKMVEKLPKSTAIVLNSFEEIDQIITQDLSSKFNHFLNIGPLFLANPPPPLSDDETGCLPWLENQTTPRSVIYVSFGTVITSPENELISLAEALEACQFPFLWSLKDDAKKSLPEGFPQRTGKFGKIVPWAPQRLILEHENVGVFVTHCGWNSILESVAGGVPMICRPFFGDQKINGRMVEDTWRIGVRVRGGVFEKDRTAEILRRVVGSEDGKIMRENAMMMKEKVVNAVGEDGSSCKNFRKLLEIIASDLK